MRARASDTRRCHRYAPIAALATLVACAEPPAPPDSAATPAAPALPGQEPTPPGSAPARREVRARVVRISVRIAESSPPQYFADITSALEDGCTQFSRAVQRRDGETVYVELFNTRPAGDQVACTMIYGEKETAVALGSDFTPGAAYVVDANGARATFVAQ
jgi:hypothetical protein